MAAAASTSITVRVQAKGGKFLADDISGSVITAVQRSTGNTGTGTVTFFVKEVT